MNRVRIIKLAGMAAIAILAAGCTFQKNVDNTTDQQDHCPSNMTLECFESPTKPTECSCVSAQELERMMEQVLGR